MKRLLAQEQKSSSKIITNKTSYESFIT